MGRLFSLLSLFWSNESRTFLWYDIYRMENDASKVICCRGNVFTEPLSIKNCWVHVGTDWGEEFMKYTVEMDTGAMIYIPNFIKIGSGFLNLRDTHKDTQMKRDQISLLSFFQNKWYRVKSNSNIILSRVLVIIDGLWIRCLDLSSPCTHTTRTTSNTAPSLIYPLYSSPLHTQ
jgi:hypothetical protein